MSPDFGHWTCPVCGYEAEGEYVVDPDLAKRIEAHKDVHISRHVDHLAVEWWIEERLSARVRAGGGG